MSGECCLLCNEMYFLNHTVNPIWPTVNFRVSNQIEILKSAYPGKNRIMSFWLPALKFIFEKPAEFTELLFSECYFFVTVNPSSA